MMTCYPMALPGNQWGFHGLGFNSDFPQLAREEERKERERMSGMGMDLQKIDC